MTTREERIRRKLFVNAYILNGKKASKAAVEVGYPREYASDLVKQPTIQQMIKEVEFTMLKRQEISIERLAKEAASIAFFDIADIFDDEGNVRPLSEIPVHARQAIADLNVNSSYAINDITGESQLEKQSVNVKLQSKMEAIKFLGSFLGMNKQVVDYNVTGAVEHKVAAIDLDERISNLLGYTKPEEKEEVLDFLC